MGHGCLVQWSTEIWFVSVDQECKVLRLRSSDLKPTSRMELETGSLILHSQRGSDYFPTTHKSTGQEKQTDEIIRFSLLG